MLGIGGQHRQATRDGLDLAAERSDRELIVPAMLPLHVAGLAVNAQPDMVGHASHGIADLELSARPAGETEANLRDIMHLAAGDHGADVGRDAYERLPGDERYQMMRMGADIAEHQRGPAALGLQPPAPLGI